MIMKTKPRYHKLVRETDWIDLCLQEANSCDGEITQLRDHQRDLSGHLENGQVGVQQLQGDSDTLDGDIDRLIEVKQKVMVILVLLQ